MSETSLIENELQQKVDSLKRRLSVCSNNRSELQEEFERASNLNSGLRQTIDSLTSKIAGKQNSFATSEALRADLEVELAKLVDSEQQENANSLERNESEDKADLIATERDVVEAEKDRSLLTQDLIKLKRNHNQQLEELNYVFHEDLKEVLQSLELASDQLDSAQLELQQKLELLQDLRTRIESMKQELETNAGSSNENLLSNQVCSVFSEMNTTNQRLVQQLNEENAKVMEFESKMAINRVKIAQNEQFLKGLEEEWESVQTMRYRAAKLLAKELKVARDEMTEVNTEELNLKLQRLVPLNVLLEKKKKLEGEALRLRVAKATLE